MFQCHVTHHIHGGMYGSYRVRPARREPGHASGGEGSGRRAGEHVQQVHEFNQGMVRLQLWFG